MINFFDQKEVIMPAAKVDIADLNAISLYKDQFLENSQNPYLASLLEPEVTASWQRSKKLQVNPRMQELAEVLRPQELKALLLDKKILIDMVKSYFATLLPLLNMPKTTLTIFDENGIILDLSDQAQLLRLNLRSGSIWREETVGTTSTSLCIAYDKAVQLAGSKHFCKALEHQIATTVPVRDSQGNKLGIITIIHNVNEILLNAETLQRILLWANTLSAMVEGRLVLLKSSHVMSGNVIFAGKNSEHSPQPAARKSEQPCDQQAIAKYSFARILGESQQIQNAIQTALRFARNDCGLLITGESGTGKELFAQAIHQVSRNGKPFVTVNCAGIPGTLMTSELFGYVGGAFTGAEHKGRPGKIELAQDGTLFLDEIGDMPLEIQPNLLRVLEDKNVIRLGSNRETKVSFRLIAATNKDLFQLVEEKKFRADLYYRLEVLRLALPPLRERGRDILLMAGYFLEHNCREAGRPPLKLSKEAEAFLLGYTWPGNVRQLKNAMIYAANICEGQVITPKHLPASLQRIPDTPCSNENLAPFQTLPSLEKTEQENIKKALLLSGNNVREAAKMLGLSKTTLYRRLKEYYIHTT